MSAGEPLAQRLNAAVGASIASSAAESLAGSAVGGMAPRVAAFPESEAQVAAVLAFANREGLSVVAWGSGHGRPGGTPPARYDVALSLTGLARILDHDSENLTLTAQAGARLADVQRQLRPKRQFLPLGFDHERRTLGGLVAANRTPPARLIHGDLRDQLLGLRVATADGALVRYGRKVLKNVAGYDMNKLFVGSEGLLGVIVEVTFKLAALPDETACSLGYFPDAQSAFACAAELFRSQLQPGDLVLLDARAGAALCQAQGLPIRPGATHLLIGFEGRGVTVKRQLADGRAALAKHGATANETFKALNEGAAQVLQVPAAGSVEPEVLLRMGVRATDLPTLWHQVGGDLASGGAEVKVADYGAGRMLVGLPASGRAADFTSRIAALRTRLAEGRGYALLERAPPAIRAQVSPWGEPGGEVALLRALKVQLDPKGTLSPGRFI